MATDFRRFPGQDTFDTTAGENQRSLIQYDQFDWLERLLGVTTWQTDAVFDWARNLANRASYGADGAAAGNRLRFTRWFHQARILFDCLPAADVKTRRDVAAKQLAIATHNRYLASTDNDRQTDPAFAFIRAGQTFPNQRRQPGESTSPIGYLPWVRGASTDLSDEQITALRNGAILDIVLPPHNALQERLSRDKAYDLAGRHGYHTGMPSAVEFPLLRPRDDIR